MAGRRQRGGGTGELLLASMLVGLPVLAVAGLGIFWGSAAPPLETPSEDDRAVAIGLLLDAPRSPEVVDEALVLAEKVRERYGIHTGNDYADREEAAERAQHEFLDRLVFSEEEIRETSLDLGYSLDPASCANYCDNVRELAIVQLQKRALRAFIAGDEWPGKLRDEAPPAATGDRP